MKRSQQAGFTLIELLVVISLVGILSSLAVQNFTEYRIMAFDHTATQTMHDTQNALEAGMIELQESVDPNLWSWIWSGGDGTLVGDASSLTPGLRVGDNVRIFAYYDGWCDNQNDPNMWCPVQYVETAHCQGRVTKAWAQLSNGEQWEWEWANWGC
jgi:prepilin-type N-terminal cleavage/methylation domain-containing protein